MEWYIFIVFLFAAVILAAVYFGIVPNQLIGAIAVMFTPWNYPGRDRRERIPVVWNKYCGGGAILAFSCLRSSDL